MRHLTPLKTHSERMKKKTDKNMVNDHDYEDIEFPVSKKNYCKIELKCNISINVYCCENGMVYHV